MDNLTKRDQPDRSKINMSEDFELKYWLKALGVSRDELKRAVDKVGNSAAAAGRLCLASAIPTPPATTPRQKSRRVTIVDDCLFIASSLRLA